MRKALIFTLTLMRLLTACGGGEETNVVTQLQQQYAAVETATMEAEIVCHYGDEVRTYTLLCAYSPEKSTVTVLAPENLAGISAQVENGTLTLSYDDISLDAGTYSAAAVSPVVALPKLMEAAVEQYGSESGMLFEAAQYYARKCDYAKAVEELEAIAAKVEDPATKLDDIDALVARSNALLKACRAYLRTVREKMDKLDEQ